MGTAGSRIDRFIGEKVKWWRREKKLMAEIVASKLGLSLEEYQVAESGNQRFAPEQLVQLSRLFDLEVEAFFPEVEIDRSPIC